MSPEPVEIIIGRKDDKIVLQTLGNSEVPASYILLDEATAESVIGQLVRLIAPLPPVYPPPTFEQHLQQRLKNPMQLGMVFRLATFAVLAFLSAPHWSGAAFTILLAFDSASLWLVYKHLGARVDEDK